jgi:hypothetical protein
MIFQFPACVSVFRDATTALSLCGHNSISHVCDVRTNIEAPHVLETPSVIAAPKYPRHIVSEGDSVCTKAVGGECPVGVPA